MFDRTIYALCTPPLSGALHVIRVCGPQTFLIVNSICKDPVAKKGHTLQHTFLCDGATVIDEVVLAKFVAPRSFTGEDTVEINCHGGMAVVAAIVDLLNSKGIQQAERGEFTKLALLNGKIDLTQAEAVDAIVRAPSKAGVVYAGRSLLGKTSALVRDFKERLLDAIALVEVNIDYPEYDDVEKVDGKRLLAMLTPLLIEAHKLVETSQGVVMAFKGIKVAIIGRPNVGKSSLLNALLGEDRAIVAPTAGTTRDVVEGAVSIRGVPVSFLDTAGIRRSRSVVEKIGIDRAKSLIARSDLVLVVIDGSKPLTALDRTILDLSKNSNRLIVRNKSDLPSKNKIRGLSISSKNNDIEQLVDALQKVFTHSVHLDNERSLLTERQIGLMRSCVDKLQTAATSLKEGATVDLVAQFLAAALEDIKAILGEQVSDGFLDDLFSRFCLGK